MFRAWKSERSVSISRKFLSNVFQTRRTITTTVNASLKNIYKNINFLESDYVARKLLVSKKYLIKGFIIWRAITTPVNYVLSKKKTLKYYVESDYDARKLRLSLKNLSSQDFLSGERLRRP